MERVFHVESRVTQGQAMDGLPKIQHVALGAARWVKALEDVLPQVD
jgi:hypothetical protein